jgi:Ion channel
MDQDRQQPGRLSNGRALAGEALGSGFVGLVYVGARAFSIRRDAVDARLLRWQQVLCRQWRMADNYGLVLVLIVLAALVTAATEGTPPARIVALLLLGGGLLFAIHTSRAAVELEGLAALVVVGAVVLAVVSIVVTGSLGLASRFDRPVAVVLVMTTPVIIGRRLLQHRMVTGSTISGALCVYLLLGLSFASLFGLTEVLGQGPYFAGQDATNDADFLYFSFATLATVGYGDLVARSNLGRMLAVTEALIGQMYLVTVVALLVGNLGRRRRERDPERDP